MTTARAAFRRGLLARATELLGREKMNDEYTAVYVDCAKKFGSGPAFNREMTRLREELLRKGEKTSTERLRESDRDYHEPDHYRHETDRYRHQRQD